MSLTVGFAGLTHLGIVSSAAAAAKGAEAVAFDPDAALVARLAKGERPIHEPGLDELVSANADRLAYTADIRDLARCDLIYVCPDVPTDDRGASDLSGLKPLLDAVAEAMRPDAILVILSQVPPGFTRVNAPAGRTVFCQVETLIFGLAVERAMKPERFIVGCADPAALLPPALTTYLGAFGCPILPMRYESAELAKISINMFLVSSVSTTNTLAELCERIGADWSEIAPALKLDRRIGPYAYLAPGLGIAGGNLERDLVTVRMLAARHGTDDKVIAAWQANSVYRRDWALRCIHRELLDRQPDALLAVWGLTYKQDTHSIKNSPSIELLRALRGVRIRAHDPAAKIPAADFPHVTICSTPLETLDGAAALLVMTPWKIYGGVSIAEIKTHLKGQLVIDPYAALDEKACRATALAYHRLGC